MYTLITPVGGSELTDLIIDELSRAGFAGERVCADAVPVSFDRESLVIALDSRRYPVETVRALNDFLVSGGRLAALGGPAFADPLYPGPGGRRLSRSELAAGIGRGEYDRRIVIDPAGPGGAGEPELFAKDSSNPDSKKYEGPACLTWHEPGILRYHTPDFYINESFEREFSFAPGHSALSLVCRSGRNTRTLSIELLLSSGALYKSRLTPGEEFSRHLLGEEDFVYAGGVSERPGGLDFGDVVKIRLGHALSHAYSVAGEHWFELTEVSTAALPRFSGPLVSVDGLCPEYRFYPVNAAERVTDGSREYPLPADLFSLSPRPRSTGCGKGRRYRFEPLIKALDEKGLTCGYAAYLLYNHAAGELAPAHPGSRLALFSTLDGEFYRRGGSAAFARACEALMAPVVLLEGGCDEYIYFADSDEMRAGASVLADSSALTGEASYAVRLSGPGFQREWPLADMNRAGVVDGLVRLDASEAFPPGEGIVTAELLEEGRVIDRLDHTVETHRSRPLEERRYAVLDPRASEITIGGRPQRFFGVNYMPSVNTGFDYGDEFEHYVAAFAYDPDIVETDLKRIAGIGMNAVSLFIHHDPSVESRNLLHLIDLCEKHGLYVNLSLRPRANPFDFSEEQVRRLIRTYRLDELDTVVGYDIAWERYVGTYEPCYGNFKGRKSFDAGWRAFLLERFGSFEAAREHAGFPLNRDGEGRVIGLSDDQLRIDGDHRVLAALYRRFIDDQVTLAHLKAADFIRSLDPRHLISARSGDASTIPLVDPGIYGYDYKALAPALDYLSPESYALSDKWESMGQGVFTNIYSRYARSGAVVQWMEFGKSIWTGSNFSDNSVSEEFQAEFYRRFFAMQMKGHSAGSYAWWWAGGYRIGERSDFGIIAPDGSDRPVTRVFREFAPTYLNAPPLKAPDRIIRIDRDAHSDGLLSLYRGLEKELFAALDAGETVAFADGGSGLTSADVPLEEVGNLPWRNRVARHLNGLILPVRELPPAGGNPGTHRRIEAEAVNTGSTIWKAGEDKGAVALLARDAAGKEYLYPVRGDGDIPPNGRALFAFDAPAEGCELRLCARGRCSFGPKRSLGMFNKA